MKYFDINHKEINIGDIVLTRNDNIGKIFESEPDEAGSIFYNVKYFNKSYAGKYWPQSLRILTEEQALLWMLEQ
jgi:hypothetical protein